jgi:hypothetical protein
MGLDIDIGGCKPMYKSFENADYLQTMEHSKYKEPLQFKTARVVAL